MTDTQLESRIESLEKKLDLLLEDLAERRQKRQANEELKLDLTQVGNDLFRSAVTELEEISPFVESGDIVYLLKKIARNTNNITSTITRFESLLDFTADASPIVTDIIKETIRKLDDLERKNVFKKLRSVQTSLEKPEELDISLYRFLKELNSREVRRGMGFFIILMKILFPAKPEKTTRRLENGNKNNRG